MEEKIDLSVLYSFNKKENAERQVKVAEEDEKEKEYMGLMGVYAEHAKESAKKKFKKHLKLNPPKLQKSKAVSKFGDIVKESK